MRLLESNIYQADLDKVCGLDLPWEKLSGKSIMISGATGMIGSTLIDVLMRKNTGCRIIALGRSGEKAKERFAEYWEDEHFTFVRCDINDRESLEKSVLSTLRAHEDSDCVQPDRSEEGSRRGGAVAGGNGSGAADALCTGTVDYIFHAASNTHPVAYAKDPIGTVVTNIIGLDNLLRFASEHGCSRFLFASSNEIYGENRGDVELFDEKYCGYIDCNTMRAGYPESKRAGEALCQAYIRQKGLDVVIPRFTRSFGPSLLKTDTKALSQFIRKGVDREDIVLKSEGTQFFSYTYVCDAVSGMLYCLLMGERGEAYNIADVSCDITLRDLAKTIADYVGTRVVFDLPDAVEAAGYSKATKARLDSSRLQSLGWRAQFDMKTALAHTIDIMRELDYI